MAGILEAIIGGISEALNAVLGPIIELAVKAIIGPILAIVLNIVSYAMGLFFYNISIFVLKLIDFVELLFRALAGLDGQMSINIGGYTGDSKDPVVQLILNPAIQEAFLAMCIVGIFLLVITTIFQIIRVEYTTEGAKNAKGPILEKAFKGLANLMLIPLLVVFGVMIGNGVLGLIDKATKGAEGDNNPTISGLLFTTAAADAFYKKGDHVVDLGSSEVVTGTVTLLSQIFDIAWNSIKDGLNVGPDEYKLTEAQRDDITNKFICQVDNGHYTDFDNNENFLYYNIRNVTEYYNFSKINYLLLIIGGGIVLKCLFFTCFGMIIRLYQCAAYFVIVPVVIGMMPVREGGFKTWVSKFMGLALSAYGTIISLNIFFIITRVMLNMEINWTGGTAGSNNWFAATTLTSLVKCVFTLGGCLMIEKLSKSFGDFFGAEDAMGAGKGLAGEMAEPAKKAIAGTMAVASGGLPFMAKVASGTFKGLSNMNKAGNAEAAVVNAEGGDGRVGYAMGAGKYLWNSVKSGAKGVKDKLGAAGKTVKDVFTSPEKALEEVQSKESDLMAARERQETAEQGFERANRKLKRDPNNKRLQDQVEYWGRRVNNAEDKVEEETKKLKGDESYQKAKDKVVRSSDRKITFEATSQALRNSALKNNAIYKFLDSAIGKPIHDASEEGAKFSDEAATAHANRVNARKDSIAKRFDASVSGAIDAKAHILKEELLQAAISNMSDSLKATNEKLEKLAKTLKETLDKATAAKGDEALETAYKNKALSIQEQMKEINGNIKFNGDLSLAQGQDIKVKLDTSGLAGIKGNNAKELEDNIKAAMEQAAKDGNKLLLEELKKALENLKNQLGGGK